MVGDGISTKPHDVMMDDSFEETGLQQAHSFHSATAAMHSSFSFLYCSNVMLAKRHTSFNAALQL